MRSRMPLLGLLVWFISRPASADGLLTPYAGYDFGGNAGHCPNLTTCSTKKWNYGIAFGTMGAGIFGVEEDIGYASDFFGTGTFGSNHVLTAMTNLIVGAPLGPVRPYASGGAGLVDISPPSILGSSSHGFGYDVGVGVMGFVADHVGLRLDYRYFRSAKDLTIADVHFAGTKLNFNRATGGVVFRF